MTARRAAAALLVVAAGCAGGPLTDNDRYYRNDIAGAAAEFERGLGVCAEKDRTVFLLESGMAHLTMGEVDAARARFVEASGRMGLLRGIGQEDAVALLGRESQKEFKGEPFEQSLCCFYEGWTHLCAGDFERAKTAFLASELNDRAEGPRPDFALPIFFEALCRLALGEDVEARERLRWLRAIDPGLEPLLARLEGGAYDGVVLVETGRGPRKVCSGVHGAALAYDQDWSEVGEVRVAVDGAETALYRLGWTFRQASEPGGRIVDQINGRKAEWKTAVAEFGGDLVLGGADAALGAEQIRKERDRVRTELDGAERALAAVEAAGDVAGVLQADVAALRRQERELARARQTASYVAIGSAALGTLLGLVSGLAQPAADVRGWTTLPEAFHVGLLRLPAGRHDVTVACYDARGGELVGLRQRWRGVPFGGALAARHFRVFPGRSGGIWRDDRGGVADRAAMGGGAAPAAAGGAR